MVRGPGAAWVAGGSCGGGATCAGTGAVGPGGALCLLRQTAAPAGAAIPRPRQGMQACCPCVRSPSAAPPSLAARSAAGRSCPSGWRCARPAASCVTPAPCQRRPPTRRSPAPPSPQAGWRWGSPCRTPAGKHGRGAARPRPHAGAPALCVAGRQAAGIAVQRGSRPPCMSAALGERAPDPHLDAEQQVRPEDAAQVQRHVAELDRLAAQLGLAQRPDLVLRVLQRGARARDHRVHPVVRHLRSRWAERSMARAWPAAGLELPAGCSLKHAGHASLQRGLQWLDMGKQPQQHTGQRTGTSSRPTRYSLRQSLPKPASRAQASASAVGLLTR